MSKEFRIGFVGVPRSLRLTTAVGCHPAAKIVAFCDVDERRAKEAAETYTADAYVDYEQMLDRGKLDAVVVATPMQLHVSQSIAALDRDIHVLSEVTAAVSIEQSEELVRAAAKSEAIYMMSENACYSKVNILIREMVKAGLFGELYFAEGEYLHELKQGVVKTPWRGKWQTGIAGCTYGSHSLGPILQWFQGQRVVSVSCTGSGHHYRDSEGNPYEQEDTILMLCRLDGGGLVKIRLDLLSERPHALMNYALQGTKGAYESSRAKGEPDRVWVQNISKNKNQWDMLKDYEDTYLPDFWKNPSETIHQAGHGGIDYFVVADFLEAIINEIPCSIDIHQAMDMTLPGLVSQESIMQGGKWLEVPDSRGWA